MGIDLSRAWARALFFVTVIVCSSVFTFFAGKACVAALCNASPNPELWRKAATLEPNDAEYWAHVGLSHQWDLSGDNAIETISDLQMATQLNPRSADLWMELADAYVNAGDSTRAQEAYDRAQASYPISPDVAWRYGNFLLYEQQFPHAYEQIRRAVSVDPSLTEKALAECWQYNPDVTAMLDQVLPRKSEYYLKAIDFFLAQKLPDDALSVWNRQRQLGLPVGLDEALPLVDVLIQQDRVLEAQQTWDQAMPAVKWPPDQASDKSLVWNGGFEHKFANGGFDWRQIPVSGARFAIDRFTSHSGSHSLRIQFDGTTNLDFAHLVHYVAVNPDTHYHFSAYLRTEQISTDRGICFEVLDPWHPAQVQTVTRDVTGTNLWTAAQAEIVTGPDTHLLEIILRRMPSWKFDNKLSGTVWIDDVNLSPVPQAGKGKSG